MARQHVLIVDDRPTNRTVFAKLAGSLGDDIAVRTCGEPREALKLLDDYTPDLIIVDYSMPEMNGAEFTRAVRARPATHEVPIVVITAYDDREFRLSALEAGATDFLQSPVDRREFQSRARAMLAFRQRQVTVLERAAAMERGDDRGAEALATAMGGDAGVLGRVLDTVPIMVSATDLAGHCLFVNAQHAAMLGASPAALIGMAVADLYEGERAEREAAMNRTVIETGQPISAFEDIIEQDGVRLTYLTNKAPLRDDAGRLAGVLTSAVDITGRKRAETHLNHMAKHDVLTGLPNRVMFRDKLLGLIGRAGAGDGDGDGRVAVFLLDLDRFKFINDSRGHRAGDQLLEQVAARIAARLGGDDIAARLGGDEFAIIQTGIADRGDAARRAEILLEAIACTYLLDAQEVVLTASLGIALSQSDSASPDELLRMADLAMYAAKAAGGNAHRFFEPEMSRKARESAELEADLHAAIEREEFEIHYQPLFGTRAGEICSAEALIRWRHPTRGMLMPGDFLRLAEETGQIIPIGAWVLRNACLQVMRWRRRGLSLPKISVNLSALQFHRQDVLGMIRGTLSETGIDPAALEIEIVESTLVRNRALVADTLREVRALGVKIAIDDFGTGYSSLQYLRDLPVDSLKLDRCFVSGLPGSTKDAAIINAITSMGHDLGLDIVAEGIETEEQRIMLRTIGCDRLQGFHLGRPCPADEFAAYLGGSNGLAVGQSWRP